MMHWRRVQEIKHLMVSIAKSCYQSVNKNCEEKVKARVNFEFQNL